MQIRLIRHGMTLPGEQKKYQGALDAPLSENGRKQLRQAAEMPDRVCVTPLVRTQETAAILFPGVRQIVVEDLREMHFGAFEGRSWQEMADDPAYREWVRGNCEGQCPGGEDKPTYTGRVCRVFEALVEEALAEQKDELVIVAHGGTQMAVLERWGDPGKAYYEWQTPCGKGWLLDTGNWPERLNVLHEITYTT